MNIIKRELRANLKALIIWSVCMFFLIFVGMVKYAGFVEAGEGVNELFKQMPPAMMNILGVQGLDLTSISGYYAVFYLYFMLLAGVHAVMLGAVIVSKEERDKTADFLLVKPIDRAYIITSKLLAMLVNLIVLNLVTLLSSIFFVNQYNQGEPITNQIVYLMLALFILQLIFAAVGVGIAAVAKNTKKAASAATAVLLNTFMLSVAIDLYDKLDFLKFLTPFQYFEKTKLMNEGAFGAVYLALSLGIIAAGVYTAYSGFKKRDVHV